MDLPERGYGWKKGLNWVWTNKLVYPFLYSHDGGSWYYLYGELEQKRMLYDYGLKSGEYLDDTEVDESLGDRTMSRFNKLSLCFDQLYIVFGKCLV